MILEFSLLKTSYAALAYAASVSILLIDLEYLDAYLHKSFSRCASGLVRMVGQRRFVIGLFDICFGGVGINAEDGIVVLLWTLLSIHCGQAMARNAPRKIEVVRVARLRGLWCKDISST